MNKSKKPKRSPRRLVNKFSIKHLLSSTPRSRKRRVLSRRRSPRKCLSYNVNSDTCTIEMHTECATEIADRSTCSEQNKQGVMDGTLNELCKEAPWMHGLVSAIKKYPSLKLRVLSEASGTSRWLEITRDQCLVEPTLGPMDVVRLLVSASTHVYQLQVLYPVARIVDRYKGIAPTDEAQRYEILDLIGEKYVLCPGLKRSFYEDKVGVTGYHRENVRVLSFPFLRYESTKCLLWHQPCNKYTRYGHDLHNVCQECKKEAQRALANAERCVLVSPEEKDARRDPTSKYPVSKLSPASASEKVKRLKKDRKNFREKIQRLTEVSSVQLDGEESIDLSNVVTHINSDPTTKEHIEALFSEADGKGHREVIESLWEQETNTRDRMEFLKDQQTCSTGDKRNRWSMVTYRIALAIFTRSPAAFEALRSLKILQLPSRSSLESFTSANTQRPGISCEYLCKEWKAYCAHKDKLSSENQLTPLAKGVLIFDEVKVQSGVCWHTSTNRIVGLALTHEELATLADVYEELGDDKPKKTTYILQFLWRDVSSKFDLIGPFFTSESGLDARFTAACLFEVMRSLEAVGFQVTCLVCDGASCNLTLLKNLCGVRGQFGHNLSDPDAFAVPCSFKNPFSDETVWCLICPSHQLKNMVSALFSSGASAGKTKLFCNEGVTFGWDTIVRLWKREEERAERGLMSEVPKLKERYIKRDSWTRLNVAPAKIMQQDKVVAEISRYGDASGDQMVVKFLTALNNMFERGILSREHVASGDAPVLQRMSEGYRFFSSWCEDVILNGVDPKSNEQKPFLAWQTWDLLRLMWYGFKGFCEEFTAKHEQYYVVPVRINGSAVESLFSRFKYDAGGNLSATNYESAISRLLTAGAVSAVHQEESAYRKDQLSLTMTCSLKRKSK